MQTLFSTYHLIFIGMRKKFIEIVKPDVAVFIKYEFWLNFLNELHIKKIPTYLISAIFHSDQPFFRWYGKNS